MLIGAHSIVYSKKPEKDRAFFRDVLQLSHVDAGEGWLIFALPPAELGVHPTEHLVRRDLSLMCDDLSGTMAELRAKGIEFAGEPEDEGFGICVTMRLPGGCDVLLYEPRHPTAIRTS